jgi:hypothetical protein
MQSRASTRDNSRKSDKPKKIVKKKRKSSKSSTKSNTRRNSKTGEATETRETSPDRAQEDADFAEEMRVQFRPFDDSTNYEDRPLSRHDRASSREGKKSAGEADLGGNMSSMFSGDRSSGAGAEERPPAPQRKEEEGGTSPKGDTFQNISFDDVGKNKEFYHKRPAAAAADTGSAEGKAEADGDGEDAYEDDVYEDEFDD